MKIPVRLVSDSVEFQTKTGKKSYRAACTFEDDGARFPLGRGTLYSAQPLSVKACSGGVTARLISYDRGEARFAV